MSPVATTAFYNPFSFGRSTQAIRKVEQKEANGNSTADNADAVENMIDSLTPARRTSGPRPQLIILSRNSSPESPIRARARKEMGFDPPSLPASLYDMPSKKKRS